MFIGSPSLPGKSGLRIGLACAAALRWDSTTDSWEAAWTAAVVSLSKPYEQIVVLGKRQLIINQ